MKLTSPTGRWPPSAKSGWSAKTRQMSIMCRQIQKAPGDCTGTVTRHYNGWELKHRSCTVGMRPIKEIKLAPLQEFSQFSCSSKHTVMQCRESHCSENAFETFTGTFSCWVQSLSLNVVLCYYWSREHTLRSEVTKTLELHTVLSDGIPTKGGYQQYSWAPA